MAIPTAERLRDPAFVKALLDSPLVDYGTPIMDIVKRLKPPKFRKAREVHAQRARKLRRRGEYVHFVRWEHGHCIYSWSGPKPDSFTFRMHPAHNALRRGELRLFKYTENACINRISVYINTHARCPGGETKMRSGVHGGPRIEVHPDGPEHGYRVLWWQSRWHTTESPDECATGYMSYAEAEDELQEYRNDRADEMRERGAEEAYEAECGHGEG